MRSERRRETLFWALLVVELALFLGWQWAHLEGFSWGSDEGIYLMRVRLMQRGHALYTDIWTDQLPGLIEALRLTFAVLGSEVVYGRGLIVLFATVGLLSTAWMARDLAGRAGALGVVPLLALWPNYYWLSRAIVSPDLPAVSLGAAGLAALVCTRQSRRRFWLAASGLLFAAACYVKATALLVVLPAAAWAIWDGWQGSERQWRSALGRLVWWGSWLGLPLLAALAFHDIPAMWQQFVGTQLRGGEMALKIGPHAYKIGKYIWENNVGLAALALAGVVAGISRRRPLWLAMVWLGLSLLALLLRSPMWPSHHLSVLLYPLALLAALALAEVWRAIKSRRLTWQLGLALLAVALYGGYVPAMLRQDVDLAAPRSYASSQEAIALLRARYPQGAEVVSDYHMIVYRAGCWTPPELATVTKKRIQLGMLNSETLIRITGERQPQVVLFWDEQLYSASAYVQWVKQHYVQVYKHNYHEIYSRPEPGEIQHLLEATLGDSIAVVGYSLADPAVLPGDEIVVSCYWRTRAPRSTKLYGFCHLLAEDGTRLAQDDHLVGGEQYPATKWMAGETIVDTYRLGVPLDAAAGVYRLSVGLYQGEGKQRLAVRDAKGEPVAGNQITLGVQPVVQTAELQQHEELPLPGGWELRPVGSLSSFALERTGDSLRVGLLWRGESPPAWPSYSVFCQLRDGDQVVAQDDGLPADGRYPTYAWRAGEEIADWREIDLMGVEPGEYDLFCGLYDRETGLRVGVVDPQGQAVPGNEIALGSIQVEQAP